MDIKAVNLHNITNCIVSKNYKIYFNDSSEANSFYYKPSFRNQ